MTMPLELQRPDIDRLPGYGRKTDYRVLRRGGIIGRIWEYRYAGERWVGLGPWHWSFDLGHQDRTPTAHAPRFCDGGGFSAPLKDLEAAVGPRRGPRTPP